MAALDLQTVRDVSIAVVVVAVVLAAAVAWVSRALVGAAVAVAAAASLGAVVWWQRADVEACADRVGRTLTAGALDDATCTFFGRDVTIPSPLG